MDKALDKALDFDPRELPTRQMGGRGEYMDVKWRLVWLRREHPDAEIVTEQIAHEFGKWATFRASVTIPSGGGASGHGSETQADFGDYYEKAETKAIGRALAALGYGAQFLPEDGEALADSPVDRTTKPAPVNRQPPRTNPPQTATAPANNRAEAVENVSWTAFWREARALGVPDKAAYVELTGQAIPETPQHAMNRLLKTIRERDAAISGQLVTADRKPEGQAGLDKFTA